MIVSIAQPAYIPWLGYFDRILKSDIHVVLDDVEMDKNSKTKFINRNKIRTPDSWAWLTIPLEHVARDRHVAIKDIRIKQGLSWGEKHWKTILLNYSRSPFFSTYSIFFEEFYKNDSELLAPLLNSSTAFILDELGIDTPRRFSSEIGLSSTKSQLILDLCIEIGASTYLSGPFGRNYLDAEKFEMCGIEILYHDYGHPIYSQRFKGFEKNMSILDLLFNYGKDSLEVLAP